MVYLILMMNFVVTLNHFYDEYSDLSLDAIVITRLTTACLVPLYSDCSAPHYIHFNLYYDYDYAVPFRCAAQG